MNTLSHLRVAVLASNGVEESELTLPMDALKKAGANVHVVSLKKGEIQAFQHHDKGQRIPVDCSLDEVKAEDYDAVVLPGGALNADFLRMQPKVQQFIRETQESGKPIAAICHAAWILISSGVIRGRTLTSYPTIQEDIRNSGGNWVDVEVCSDQNWVTSRKPSDIPAFNREMINLFSRSTPAVVQIEESA